MMRFYYLTPLLILLSAPLYAGPIRAIPLRPTIVDPPEISLLPPAQSLQPSKSSQLVPTKISELPSQRLQSAHPSDIVNLIRPERPPAAAIVAPAWTDPLSAAADSPSTRPAGIITMKRTAALVLGAFLAASSSAAEALEPTPRELQKTIDDLRGDLLSLRSTLESLKSQIERKDSSDKMREIGDKMALQTEEVNKRMMKMQKEIDDMKFDSKSSKISSSNRIDLTTPPIAMPTGRTASVRFKNDYIEDVTLVLNNTSYRLTPGNDVTFKIPAGRFSYRVLPLQDAIQNRTIDENETRQVRIFLD